MRPLLSAVVAFTLAAPAFADGSTKVAGSAPAGPTVGPTPTRTTVAPTATTRNATVNAGVNTGVNMGVTAPTGAATTGSAVPLAGAAAVDLQPDGAAVIGEDVGVVTHGAARNPGEAAMAAQTNLTKTAKAFQPSETRASGDGAALGTMSQRYDNAELHRALPADPQWSAVGAKNGGVVANVEHLARAGDAEVSNRPQNALSLYQTAIKTAKDAAMKDGAITPALAEQLADNVLAHMRNRTESVKPRGGGDIIPGALEGYVAQAYAFAGQGEKGGEKAEGIFTHDIAAWQRELGGASLSPDLAAIRADVQKVARGEALVPERIHFKKQGEVFVATNLPQRASPAAAAASSRVPAVPRDLAADLNVTGEARLDRAAPPDLRTEMPRGVLAATAAKMRHSLVDGAVFFIAVEKHVVSDWLFGPRLSEARLAPLKREPSADEKSLASGRSDLIWLDLSALADRAPVGLQAELERARSLGELYAKLSGSRVFVDAAAAASAAAAKANAAERRELAASDLKGGAADLSRRAREATFDYLDDVAVSAMKGRGLKALAYADLAAGVVRLESSEGTAAKRALLASMGFQAELDGSALRAWTSGPGAASSLEEGLRFLTGRESAAPSVDAAALARAVDAAEAKPQSRLPIDVSRVRLLGPDALVLSGSGRRYRAATGKSNGKSLIVLREALNGRLKGVYSLAPAH